MIIRRIRVPDNSTSSSFVISCGSTFVRLLAWNQARVHSSFLPAPTTGYGDEKTDVRIRHYFIVVMNRRTPPDGGSTIAPPLSFGINHHIPIAEAEMELYSHYVQEFPTSYSILFSGPFLSDSDSALSNHLWLRPPGHIFASCSNSPQSLATPLSNPPPAALLPPKVRSINYHCI